jgi:hypothetical protein
MGRRAGREGVTQEEEGVVRMRDVRWTCATVPALIVGVILIGGCGMFSRTPTAEPSAGGQAAAAAAPAPPPPARPSLREAGARIADEETLKDLVQGKTTKSEVRERFGMPQEVVFSPGIETFIYYRDRTSGWFTRTTERVEMLTVRFDSQGLLKDFEYRLSGK